MFFWIIESHTESAAAQPHGQNRVEFANDSVVVCKSLPFDFDEGSCQFGYSWNRGEPLILDETDQICNTLATVAYSHNSSLSEFSINGPIGLCRVSTWPTDKKRIKEPRNEKNGDVRRNGRHFFSDFRKWWNILKCQLSGYTQYFHLLTIIAAGQPATSPSFAPAKQSRGPVAGFCSESSNLVASGQSKNEPQFFNICQNMPKPPHRSKWSHWNTLDICTCIYIYWPNVNIVK